MNRLYQWLQERATSLRTGSQGNAPRRMMRTEITVEEQQRTVLLSLPTFAGICLCPLCGHPVAPLPGTESSAVTLDHSQVHAHCPGPEDIVQEKDPRLGRPRNTRRLR